MTSRCKMPDLQMELMTAVRAGEKLEAEFVFHLDDCDPCRAAVEGLRRMASVWIADQPSENAIALAAARFRPAARPSASLWPGPLSFAFAGAVAGLALVLAVQKWGGRSGGTARPSFTPTTERTLALPSSPSVADPRAPSSVGATNNGSDLAVGPPHVEGPHGAVPLVDGLRVELEEGESARVILAHGQSSKLRGPGSFQFWSSSTEVGGWRFSRVEPTSAGSVLAEPRESATDPPNRIISSHETPLSESLGTTQGPKFERAWARAVEALRRDDFDAADQAFDELRRSPDAPTRDAARLARAQLWIAHGWGAAARPVLEDLAASGATSLVRQRAAEFLARERH
jgi:hypothetical protein